MEHSRSGLPVSLARHRLPLEERYGTHERYVQKVHQAATRMVQQRFLLQEDADRLIREAEASAVLR